MSNLTPYLNDISSILKNSERPELALLQRYETTSDNQKIKFILSMIGKLIEQDRMLRVKHKGI
ncbi:MAG: hypothetical protein RAM37_13910 [Arsenophonus sp.]|nr:hypothetical protein [Arsenophonus sp.]MDR5611430.1 hypothetical protein [Arsenophonus sp.]